MGRRPESLMPGASLRVAVVQHEGHKLALGAALPGRMQMLVFERGHWCSSCRRHLALVAEQHDAFANRSIDIVAVTHESASDVRDRVYPFPIIADPDLAIATEFGLVGDDEFAVRTIRPSTIVVGDNNVVAFSYVGDDSRDRPTIRALLLAIDHLV